jgi:hypothetical protein
MRTTCGNDCDSAWSPREKSSVDCGKSEREIPQLSSRRNQTEESYKTVWTIVKIVSILLDLRLLRTKNRVEIWKSKSFVMNKWEYFKVRKRQIVHFFDTESDLENQKRENKKLWKDKELKKEKLSVKINWKVSLEFFVFCRRTRQIQSSGNSFQLHKGEQ